MKKFKVQYSSNNSGGSWWLDDDDWKKLEPFQPTAGVIVEIDGREVQMTASSVSYTKGAAKFEIDSAKRKAALDFRKQLDEQPFATAAVRNETIVDLVVPTGRPGSNKLLFVGNYPTPEAAERVAETITRAFEMARTERKGTT